MLASVAKLSAPPEADVTMSSAKKDGGYPWGKSNGSAHCSNSDTEEANKGSSRFHGFQFDSEDDERANGGRVGSRAVSFFTADEDTSEKKKARRGGRRHRKAGGGAGGGAGGEAGGAGGGTGEAGGEDTAHVGGPADGADREGNGTSPHTDGEFAPPSGGKKKAQGDVVRHAMHPEKNQFANHYKTRLCKVFLSGEMCMYGDRCRFAHGEAQLRTYVQNQRDGLISEEAVQKFVLAGGLSAAGRKQLDEAVKQAATTVVVMANGSFGERQQTTNSDVGADSTFIVTAPSEEADKSGPGAVPDGAATLVEGMLVAGKGVSSRSNSSALSPAAALNEVPSLISSGEIVDPSVLSPFSFVNGHLVASDGSVISLDSLSKEQTALFYREAMKEQFKGVKGHVNSSGTHSEAGAKVGAAQSKGKGKEREAKERAEGKGNCQLPRQSPLAARKHGRISGFDPHDATCSPGESYAQTTDGDYYTSMYGHLPLMVPIPFGAMTNAEHSQTGFASMTAGFTSPTPSNRLPSKRATNYNGSQKDSNGGGTAAASFLAPPTGDEGGMDPHEHSSREGNQSRCDYGAGELSSSVGAAREGCTLPVTGTLKLRQQQVKTYLKGLLQSCYERELGERVLDTRNTHNSGAKDKDKKDKDDEHNDGDAEQQPEEHVSPLFVATAKNGEGEMDTARLAKGFEDPQLMLDFYKGIVVAAHEMVSEIEDAFPGAASTLWPTFISSPPPSSMLSPSVGIPGFPATTPVSMVTPYLHSSNLTAATAAAAGGAAAAAATTTMNPYYTFDNPLLASPQQQQQLYFMNQQQQQQMAAASNYIPSLNAFQLQQHPPHPMTAGGGNVFITSPTQTPLTTPANIVNTAAEFRHVLSPHPLLPLTQQPRSSPTAAATATATAGQVVSPIMFLPFSAQPPAAATATSVSPPAVNTLSLSNSHSLQSHLPSSAAVPAAPGLTSEACGGSPVARALSPATEGGSERGATPSTLMRPSGQEGERPEDAGVDIPMEVLKSLTKEVTEQFDAES